jgi:hypothetical protein
MAYDKSASISGSVIRITRLNADGSTASGPSASFVTRAFISVKITPEYEAGIDITQKLADGTIGIAYKTPNTLKRVNLTVGVENPDPELTEIISGGVILGASQGYAAPNIGENATPNGVAIEVWSKAILNGRPAAVNPYWHWLLPYTVVQGTGDKTIAEGVLMTEFAGWGVGNPLFGLGSGNTPTWPWITDRAYAYARTASIPTVPSGGSGYVATTP